MDATLKIPIKSKDETWTEKINIIHSCANHICAKFIALNTELTRCIIRHNYHPALGADHAVIVAEWDIDCRCSDSVAWNCEQLAPYIKKEHKNMGGDKRGECYQV